MTNYLMAALAVLGFLDGLTTYIALRDGSAREGNKLLAGIISRFGLVPALTLIKGGYTGAILVGVYLYQDATYVDLGLVLACLVYAWVVRNNAKIIGWI